ncbi:hypothetical protein F4781DRAFT_435931 [Annulohypoxylon bovei var. microspora]|nr:hypothetical protein F4781DRAFT_435931 [Annulohypoxylon bovei var. microspora]
MENDVQYPIARTEIIKSCPGKQASPSAVRDWIRTYLFYRGLDPDASDTFLWRGIELYRADVPELKAAFKKNCDLQGWEADIIANDVYTILERAIPLSTRTFFQIYVYYLMGFDYYRKLMFHARDPTWMDYLVGILTWAQFLAGHFVVGIMAYIIFWVMTNR